MPVAGAVGTVSDGATLLSSVAKSKATEFNVAGLSGDFQLAWHKPNPAAESPVALESVGTVLARLDGRSISTEATFSIRSLGALFDRLSIRLPPGAELLPGKTDGYTMTLGESAKDTAVGTAVALPHPERGDGATATPTSMEGKTPAPRSVEVRLPKETIGPVEIHLNSRRVYDPMKNPGWCELAGFEVAGAARQWGTLAVAADPQWQVLWGPSRETRQIDPLPDALRKDDVAAGFEYSSEPYSLSVKLTPRKTRINVEPEYVLSVDRGQVRLDGKLTYTIRGANVSTLEVAAAGWELDEVEPENLVAIDGVTTDSGVVSIPLKRPSMGSVELRLRAHRAIGAKATSLVVPLPRPRGGIVGATSLAVVAADNLELTPNVRRIEGLERQRIAPPMKLPVRQQQPLYYRGVGSGAVFAADFRIHSQRIAVDAAAEATFNQRIAAVKQTFSYSIAYEPADHLTIAVPRELASARRVQVRIDGGEPIFPVLAGKDLADGPSVHVNIALPEPRIGHCELVLNYDVPLSKPASAQPAAVAIPLAMPADGELLSNAAIVKTERNVSVAPRKGAWTAFDRNDVDSTYLASVETSEARHQKIALLRTKGRSDSLDLEMRRDDSVPPELMLVDRAWIQSWLTSTARQDRAVFQFATDRKELEVALPAGAAVDQTAAMVDGRLVEPRVLDENRLSIPLSTGGDVRRFVVELRYHFAGQRPPRGSMRIDFPRLNPDAWVRRMYWQLILPANEHLIATPRGFTGEFVWEWGGWFWGRTPLLDQTQLESWAGAAPRDGLPDRANTYLFSMLGTPHSAEIGTAGRTWIVLWAAGAALVAGLLLIYVPLSRHPATLLIVGVALLATGLIAPEPTLLLAQAACLGLALTLLAGLLERGVARRRRFVAHKDFSGSRIEVGSVHVGFPSAILSNPPSTEPIQPVAPPSTGSAVQ